MALFHYKETNTSSGFVAFITVLIISSIAMSILVGVTLLSINLTRDEFVYENSHKALAYADYCAEEALMQLRLTTSLVGTTTLTFSDGTCAYTITNIGGNNRTIDTVGTVSATMKKLQLNLTQINPTIVVASWLEN